MKILQICQRPQRRGAEVFATLLAAELGKQGHEVMTAYLYPHVGEGLLPLEKNDRVLGGDDRHPLETLVGFHPGLLLRLGRVIRSFRPDIIQVNGARSVKYGILARLLVGAPSAAIIYRNIGMYADWVRGARRQFFYRSVFRGVDGVAAISLQSMAGLHDVLPEETPRAVISNAVAPTSLRPVQGRDALRRMVGTPFSSPVAIFVGSLSVEKRVDRLIPALGRVRSGGTALHLWIVGEGPQRRDLEERARQEGVSDFVHFFGSREDVGSCLAAADFLALVSDSEGVPAVVLEAGCLGLPVVAPRVGGLSECVRQEETGLLVAAGEEDALVGALSRLAGDAALRARHGSRSRERVLKRHSVERIAEQFLAFYRIALAGRNGQSRAASVHTRRRDQTSRAHPPGPPAAFPAEVDRYFSAELRLLTLCARRDFTPEIELRALALLGEDPDWSRLFELARRHRLTPLLTVHLRRLGARMPDPIDRALAAEHRLDTFRVLERIGQLREVVHGMRDRDILAVPYKGPALAAQLYGSPGLRLAGDIDVVVRPRDVPEARKVLGALGYRSTVKLDEPRVRFMIRHRYHEKFIRADGGHVELHWAFSNREAPFELDLDGPFARLQSLDLAGQVVPTFHPEDLLLMLCVHGAKHRWDRMEWLCGVAQLLRQAHDKSRQNARGAAGAAGGAAGAAAAAEVIDWNAVVGRASFLGVRRTLFLGLRLASELLEAPVPESLLQHARADRMVARLSREVLRLLCRNPAGWEVSDRFQRDRFRIRLRERSLDRAKFAWHRATTPSDPSQWRVTEIGRWRISLHPFRRPIHIAAEGLNALRALLPSSA
jgi:glycosyltransferase involved in cell wall biosynthesis